MVRKSNNPLKLGKCSHKGCNESAEGIILTKAYCKDHYSIIKKQNKQYWKYGKREGK